MHVQVAGIHVEKGDSISSLSVSDGATACITRKKHQIFVCINFRVMKCDMYVGNRHDIKRGGRGVDWVGMAQKLYVVLDRRARQKFNCTVQLFHIHILTMHE